MPDTVVRTPHKGRALVVDTRLSEEQQDLCAAVARFAREVIAPVAAEHDARKTFPYDVVAQMASMGLFGLPFPEESGGMGGDYLELCLAIEEIARVDQSVAITLEAAVSLGAMPVHKFGTDEQKRRWLPDLVSGRRLGAFALTESGAGSDVTAMRTTARTTDGGWVLNGTKEFITNSGTDITSVITVCAVTGRKADGRPVLSSFLVPADAPGVTIEPAYDKVGWHASDTHPITLSEVHVGADALLGDEGRGYSNFLSILDEGRIAIAALATGAAQGCVDESIKYAKEREAFGRPIAGFQSIAFMIADMEARTQAARAMWRHAASLMRAGLPYKKEASIAKLVASNAAMDNARAATQIHGGYGFMNEYPVARQFRDSKILEIGEGTSEVQRMLIARELGLPT